MVPGQSSARAAHSLATVPMRCSNTAWVTTPSSVWPISFVVNAFLVLIKLKNILNRLRLTLKRLRPKRYNMTNFCKCLLMPKRYNKIIFLICEMCSLTLAAIMAKLPPHSSHDLGSVFPNYYLCLKPSVEYLFSIWNVEVLCPILQRPLQS